MSVVENPEASGPSVRAVQRRVVNEVVAIDERTSEIRFGDNEYLLVPVPINRIGANQWRASMRRVDSIELQLGMPGPVAKLQSSNSISKRCTTVRLSTALGLIDSGVRGQITIKRDGNS